MSTVERIAEALLQEHPHLAEGGIGWIEGPAQDVAETAVRVFRDGADDTPLHEETSYPRRCSQCGGRWIDRACGPTHAVVADELGLNGLRIALVRLYDAMVVEGRSPAYHREQKAALCRRWPTLADAIAVLLTEAGLSGERPVRGRS